MNRSSKARRINFGAKMEKWITVQADLATTEGVDQLYEKIDGRPVAALLANAGREVMNAAYPARSLLELGADKA
jgi:hypothetical protein